MALTDKLTAIADAIRGKTGKADGLTLEQMAAEIAGIQAGDGKGEQYWLDKIAEAVWPTGNIVLNTEAVGAHAFPYNTKITGVSSDTITAVAKQAFYQCANLATLNLPNLVNASQNSFEGCNGLTALMLPKLKAPGLGAFKACVNLVKVDFPMAEVLNNSAFYGCSKLNTIILRSSTLCRMEMPNCLQNTPFYTNGTGGTVYVPAALIEAYKTATNWATLYAAGTCNFVAIEGSEYE